MNKTFITHYQISRTALHIAVTNLEAIATTNGKPQRIYTAYKQHLIDEGKEMLQQLRIVFGNSHYIKNLEKYYNEETNKLNHTFY